MSMADTRLYLVAEKAEGGRTRLIEATSAAAAVRHCAKERFEARAAKPGDVRMAMEAGTKVEKAGDE
jgi:hypothetical protein